MMPYPPSDPFRAAFMAASISLLGASSIAAEPNSVTIEQAGTGNHAYIEQVSGVGNLAVVHQARNSARAHASVVQMGNDNTARLSQDGGVGNFALVKSVGDRNRHTGTRGVEQNGSYNTSMSVIAGNDNRFAVSQASAGGPNLVAQLQVGDRNAATTTQSNDFGAAFEPDAFTSMARSLTVDAPGAAAGALEFQAIALPILSANAALQIQAGDDNTVTGSQSGSSNLLIQKQVGDRNTMSAEQTGSFNFLTHIQIGNDIASPTVHQTGGAAAVIVQTR